MRLALVLTCAAVLAGCATPLTPEQINARAKAASDYQLCEVAVLGNPDQRVVRIVGWEIHDRRLDCARYAQAIVQQDASRRQAAAAYLASMPKPQAYQLPLPPQPVNCTSSTYGNQTYTNCR